MNFSEALTRVKNGRFLRRAGWNGTGMHIRLVSTWQLNEYALPETWAGLGPFIAIFTSDRYLVPWVASQTDLLADDWELAT